MKRLLLATLLTMGSAFTAQAEVSITVGQPGFYGRIDLGGYPQPQLVFPQPVTIIPVATPPAPVYLRVPPGHAKDWGKHCHHYNACGEPVYFVQDNWYEREYVPRYQERHGRKSDENRREYQDADRHEHRHEGQREDKDDNKREHKHEHKKHDKGNHENKHQYNKSDKQHGHNKGKHGNKGGNKGNHGNKGGHGKH